MDFLSGRPEQPTHLGILPGTFNPPTCAHLALATAVLADARAGLDAVIFILPKALPHKTFEGATFAQRAHMLRVLLNDRARLAAATTNGGLFLEIAQECRAAFNPALRLSFICGRDAAERIVAWDYGILWLWTGCSSPSA